MNKWKKWIPSCFFAAALTIGLTFCTAFTTYAQGGYDRRQSVAQEELAQEPETPLLGDSKAKSKAWQKINGVCYNGSGKKIPGAITRGIDVSEYQDTINWKKVKNAGVDFAIVRIAHGLSHLDKKFDYNMEQAEIAGVPVGTYVYSTALTTETALKEAHLAIEKMDGYKVSYPVVYDLEYSQMGTLSPQKVSQLALTFCNEVRKAGYYPMVYCNTYWYDNHIDWSMLSGLDVWIARYGDTIQAPSDEDYHYTIWQCTDGDGGGALNPTKGLIDGIPTWNNIDLDFGFVDYTKKIAPRTGPVSGYKPSLKPNTSQNGGESVVKNGWSEEGDDIYYYVNDKKVTGWRKIEGKYYYFSSKKGMLYRNTLLTSSNLNICYVDDGGARVTNQWIDWEGKRYYMGSNGYAVKNFNKIDGKYYYFNQKYAYMYKNCKIISKAGNIYYVGEDGARYEKGFYQIEEKGKVNTYYFNAKGRAYKGWHTINKKKYYFYKGTSEKSGVRAENITLTSNAGVVSVFDENGVCVQQYKKKK